MIEVDGLRGLLSNKLVFWEEEFECKLFPITSETKAASISKQQHFFPLNMGRDVL